MQQKDTAHPFRSAAVAALIMPSLGFEPRKGTAHSELEAWSALVISAQRPDGKQMIHDHTKLREIINGIYQCWGKNTSATRVLKTILLHQSLPTIADWENPVLLTDKELSFALSLRDMEVLGPLLVADSDAWNIFDEPRNDYLLELRANNAKTRQRISMMSAE